MARARRVRAAFVAAGGADLGPDGSPNMCKWLSQSVSATATLRLDHSESMRRLQVLIRLLLILLLRFLHLFHFFLPRPLRCAP